MASPVIHSGHLAGDPARQHAAAEECSLEAALAIHSSAAESGRLADGEQSIDRPAGAIQHPALEVGLDAAHALAADHVLADRHQRPCARIQDLLELAGPQPVARPAPREGDAPQLLVIVEARPALDGRIVVRRRRIDRREVDDVVSIQRIHALDQFGQRVGKHDVLAVARQLLVEPAIAEQDIPRDRQPPPVPERGIEFRARDAEFLQRDLPVQQLPAVTAGLPADLRDEIVRVVTRHERHRADALAARIEPERGFRRHQRQPVAGLARPPMTDAGGVVPLPVQVRDPGPDGGGGHVHRSVGELVRSVQDDGRRVAPVGMPVLPHALEVAVDSARGDDDRFGRDLEWPAIRLDHAVQSGDATATASRANRRDGRSGIRAVPAAGDPAGGPSSVPTSAWPVPQTK